MTDRFPVWLRKRFPSNSNVSETKELLQKLNLHTVCQSAVCPNLGDCFARKTATFLIMGDTCTRNCRFCAIQAGVPVPLDRDEPSRIAEAVEILGLRHVVITSVTRDDLEDGGADHYVACVNSIRTRTPDTIIEVLTPDFEGNPASIDLVTQSHPHIYNHNVETVLRLYNDVRPKAGYTRSLSLLERVKAVDSSVFTKSGLMVGIGESFREVIEVMQDLRKVGCDILTVGQYLRPSPKHVDVSEYIRPEVFEEYRLAAEEMQFRHVAVGPFVRSSFNAMEFSTLHINGN